MAAKNPLCRNEVSEENQFLAGWRYRGRISRLDAILGLPYESASQTEKKGFAMSRRCELTGKGVLSGHLVSHANNKTKRVFRPNLQTVNLASDTLGGNVSLKVSMAALRTVDRIGGLDAFLMKARNESLSEKALRLKRQIIRKQAKIQAAAA